jgi:phosphotransferase system HPr (HPr) family protein
MSEAALSRTVMVQNRAGLHARACVLIAEVARRFAAKVTITKGNERVEATEVLQLLSLGAAQGEELSLDADGEDAPKVLAALEQLFAEKFGED